MEKPEIKVNTTFPLKRSAGVDRVAVDDMDAWEIREAYYEMLDALIDIIESFEGGYEAKNTLASIDKAKQALIKAGCTDE